MTSEITLKVEGMSCEGCENRIKNALKNIDGVKEVLASHEKKEVKIISNDDMDKEIFIQKIEDIGFKVV